MRILTTALAIALMAGTTLGAVTPALAQKKDEKGKPAQAAPMKLSKPIQAVAVAVQKLQQAGDHAGAWAKLAEAAAVPRTEKDDAYIMAQLKLASAQALKDNAKIEEALTDAVAAPSIPAEQRLYFTGFVIGFAEQRKDYEKVLKYAEPYLLEKPNEVSTLLAMAGTYTYYKDKAKVVDYLTRAIDVREKEGKKGDESWYAIRAQNVIDSKATDKVLPALLSLVKAFPTASNFNSAISNAKSLAGPLDNNILLDWSRLERASGALVTNDDYLIYVETAVERGMPFEADEALKEGIQKGLLKSASPAVVENAKIIAEKVAASKAELAGVERDAKTNPRLALVAADQLTSLRQYEKALPLYNSLIGKPGIDQDTVALRMGIALLNSGDKAAARDAFAKIVSGPRAAIARFFEVVASADPA